MMSTEISTDTTRATTPDAEPTIDALALSDDVRRAVSDMGYVHPTPVQLATYEPITQGKDLIVQSRTGTGKTAAFGIPLVDRLVRADGGQQALILAPTRELALQSSRELGRIGKYKGIHTAAVYGGAPMERQVRELREGAQIVSGTPGRVLDHLRRGTLRADAIRILVLDEADEMLSMGFAKELNAILEELPKPRQTLLFSATVESEIQRMAQRHMTTPEFVGLSSDQVGAKGIDHFVYLVGGTARTRDLVRILEVEDPENAMIFCNMKVETERVAAALQQAGYDADWLNGDLPQGEREKVMGRMRGGELRFLVVTDVAARGIDISHVTHVINYTFPEAVEQYIHRTGRTGRAGRTGTAISLVSPQELGSLYYLRLQYKIFPIERSLPTSSEERTRMEADRLTMLEEAFGKTESDIDRAVARRLLTHPEAERLVGGLLSAFFGARGSTEEVDEQAAASRRARRPEPAPERAEAREEERETGRGRRRSRRRGRRDDAGEPAPARAFDEDAQTAEIAMPEAESRDRDRGGPAEPDEVSEADFGNGDDDETSADMTRLYINLGRRDGVRAGEINRLLRERCELSRADIGRIRVRDKHTFVDVLTGRVEGVVEKLGGQTVQDRELVVEPARVSR